MSLSNTWAVPAVDSPWTDSFTSSTTPFRSSLLTGGVAGAVVEMVLVNSNFHCFL